MKRPDNGLPEDIREHMKLMCDVVALAFQTDKTRFATLLLCRDISCLVFVNNMWSGNKHDSNRLPLLTVGGLGGTLETGRVMDYSDRGDDGRKLCSLYLSLMHRMGLPADQFGDATTQLADL